LLADALICEAPLKVQLKSLLPKTHKKIKNKQQFTFVQLRIAAEQQFLHCFSELTPDVLFDGSETLD
jgi:hypothetical protein